MSKPVDLTIIKAARLLDGYGGPCLERASVLIDGDKIAAVGTEETVIPPDGAVVTEYNYEDKTILPGLVDCHVHLNGIGDGRKGDELASLPDEILTLQAARNSRTHLFSGVTTVRDCGAKNKTTFMVREAVEMGIMPAPRLVLAGRPIAIIGGHLSYFGMQVTGEVESQAAVRQLVKEGADFIKITATGGSTRTSLPFRMSFTVEEIRAICDEAHKFGLHVAAHCSSSQGMLSALDGGVDTLIHALHKEPDGNDRYRPEITERIVNQGVFVNATLHQGRNRIWQLEEKMETHLLTEEEQKEIDLFRDGHDVRVDHVSRMRAEGVNLVCGSDASWAYYPIVPGTFQDEIDAHIEIGMSPDEAIVAATKNSAKSCWVSDKVGTLEPGKQADVLVVDGDPSQHIGDLKRIADVFQRGVRVDRGNYV